VVRHHDEQVARAQRRGGLADDLIEADVQVVDDVRVGRILRGVVRGMTRVPRPPHHVRDLIDVAEVVEEQAVAEAVEDVMELRLDLVARDLRLRQKLVA
jgi:hypothetical protein